MLAAPRSLLAASLCVALLAPACGGTIGTNTDQRRAGLDLYGWPPNGDGGTTGSNDQGAGTPRDLAAPIPRDLARPLPDLRPPITVICAGGRVTCRGSARICCVPVIGPEGCIAPGSNCIGSTYECDGTADCNEGEECCDEVGKSSCQRLGSCGRRLCRGAQDCRLGQRCCPSASTAYTYCAQLCN